MNPDKLIEYLKTVIRTPDYDEAQDKWFDPREHWNELSILATGEEPDNVDVESGMYTLAVALLIKIERGDFN
jgi:hypothetical protein